MVASDANPLSMGTAVAAVVTLPELMDTDTNDNVIYGHTEKRKKKLSLSNSIPMGSTTLKKKEVYNRFRETTNVLVISTPSPAGSA